MSMTHNEMIAVIEAARDGKPTEWRYLPTHKWSPFKGDSWNFTGFEYRIKPEPPKPREWWIFPMAKGEKGDLYELGSQARAVNMAGVIHVREVLPDEEAK